MKRPLDPRIDDDDAALFRAAVGDAIRLRVAPRRPPATHSGPPVPVQSLLDEHAALAESRDRLVDPDAGLETGEEAAYLREGLSRQVLRKLRRGHWVVQDELDLHGLTRAEARVAVAEFVREAVRRTRRCVRIIHGKGRGSRNREPVLKSKVRGWLAQREEVLAFCQAPAAHGGGGALLVLLRG